MSRRGMTTVPGHGLQGEGRWRMERDGSTPSRDGSGAAYCSCGALSEPGISISAAKRWHAEHKAEVRASVEAPARALYEAHGLLQSWDEITEWHRDCYRKLALKGRTP